MEQLREMYPDPRCSIDEMQMNFKRLISVIRQKANRMGLIRPSKGEIQQVKVDRILDVRDKLFSPDETNSQYSSIVKENTILYPNGNNIHLLDRKELEKAFTIVEKLQITPISSLWKVFRYFNTHGAATVDVLIREIDLKASTTYKLVKELKTLDLISLSSYARAIRRRGGPRAHVWAVPSVTEEEVRNAIRLHNIVADPVHRLAYSSVQSLLEEYFTYKPDLGAEAIHRNDIVSHYRNVLKTDAHLAVDLAEASIWLLKEKGIKVIR